MKKYQKILLFTGIPFIATWMVSNVNSYNRQKDMLINAYASALERGANTLNIQDHIFRYDGSYFDDLLEKVDVGSGKAMKDFLNGDFSEEITEILIDKKTQTGPDLDMA